MSVLGAGALGLADGFGDAGEEGVDGFLVGAGGGFAAEVGGDVLDGVVEVEDLALEALRVGGAAVEVGVDLVGKAAPGGVAGTVGGLVAYDEALGFGFGERDVVQRGVAVSDCHTAQQGEGILPRERLYEGVHVHFLARL